MNPRLGLVYGILAALSYATMSYLVHWNPRSFPVEQMTLVRGVITTFGVLPFCWRELGKFFAPGAPGLWFRGFIGSVGLFLYYITLQGTTSGNANFLFWAPTPLFVSLLAWLFLRERLTGREIAGIAVVLLANVLLYIPTRTTMPLWVWATGTAGGFVSALAYFTLGSVTKRYSSSLIVFSFGAMSIVFSLFWPGKPWISPTSADWLYLCVSGVLGLGSQFFTTLSFVHLKSGIATSLGRTSVLFSGALDITLGGYHPHWLEWVSYVVVITGIWLTQKTRAAAAKPLKSS